MLRLTAAGHTSSCLSGFFTLRLLKLFFIEFNSFLPRDFGEDCSGGTCRRQGGREGGRERGEREGRREGGRGGRGREGGREGGRGGRGREGGGRRVEEGGREEGEYSKSSIFG